MTLVSLILNQNLSNQINSKVRKQVGHREELSFCSKNTLVDDSFFKNLDSLTVKPLSYLSDHCQVVTSIKFNNKYEKPATNTDYQWVSLPKFFIWNSQTPPKEYLDALNSPHYRSKIEKFTSAIFPEN